MKVLIFRNVLVDNSGNEYRKDKIHIFKDDSCAEIEYSKLLRGVLKDNCVSTTFINNLGGKTVQYKMKNETYELDFVSVH